MNQVIEAASGVHAPWYVVYTKKMQEVRALTQLENQRFTCYLPTLQTWSVSRGKPAPRTEPLFPRYLFLRMDEASKNWSAVRSTRGVSELVMFGGRPATLPHVLIAAMQKEQRKASRPAFKPGESVVVTHGPFAGLNGIYQLNCGNARALVLIELMSQPRKLKLAIDALSKAQ